jgi:hypothetical protein
MTVKIAVVHVHQKNVHVNKKLVARVLSACKATMRHACDGQCFALGDTTSMCVPKIQSRIKVK